MRPRIEYQSKPLKNIPELHEKNEITQLRIRIRKFRIVRPQYQDPCLPHLNPPREGLSASSKRVSAVTFT
jgi:hypothetical protein